jgi:hypothetical protein
MKKCNVIIGSVLVLLLCSTALFAGEQGKVGPWVKINEKDGIVAYARTNSMVSPLKEGRVVGVIDSSAENVENAMRDWDAYKKVLFMSKVTKPVDNFSGCKPSADTYCAYLLQGAPWPVEDRDGYGSLDFYIQKPANEILVKITVRENNMPLTKGVTRIPFCDMEWLIKPIDATHCQVTYQNMLKSGGAMDKMPAPVMNYVMKHFGIFTVENIRKLLKEDKYKHSKGFITQTPWPDELRYYAEEVTAK